MKQMELFPILDPPNDSKTYRAIRHDVVRFKQKINDNSVHHPIEKIKQIKRVLNMFCGWGDLSILELFAGHGNCSVIYAQYGEVTANELNKKVYQNLVENTKNEMLVQCNNVNSFYEVHRYLYLKQKFDVIDIDPYGFPNRFFPDIFKLIDNGVLFITMPKPFVNILNGITATHLTAYYGEKNPSLQTIIEKIALFGICHWRQVELVDCIDLKSVWRMAFKVTKVKATEYCNVKNR